MHLSKDTLKLINNLQSPYWLDYGRVYFQIIRDILNLMSICIDIELHVYHSPQNKCNIKIIDKMPCGICCPFTNVVRLQLPANNSGPYLATFAVFAYINKTVSLLKAEITLHIYQYNISLDKIMV